jgi:hypothetical protein
LDTASIESFLISTGQPFEGGHIVSDVALSLDSVKDRKRTQINQARLSANRTNFVFGGKTIACDELSRSDIDATNGIVAVSGQLPDGWVGGWKAVDNTYVAIPDVATWIQFYSAMVAKGLSNFTKAQTLKGMVNAASTAEEVDAIDWNSVS